MKFEEILPLLKEGKKIRKASWFEGHYFKLASDGIVDQDGKSFTLGKDDLLYSDWEIFREKKKVKLRDLTAEQYKKWKDDNCWVLAQIEWCVGCPFESVRCRPDENPRYLNKDIFNDKFLDQEVEIEED